MNLPYQQAMTHFGDEFSNVMQWYLEWGYVYIGPDLFLLACAHDKDHLINVKKSVDICDCWCIQYAYGNIKRIFEVCPFEKEWVVFKRLGSDKYRVYNFKKMKRRIYGTA